MTIETEDNGARKEESLEEEDGGDTNIEMTAQTGKPQVDNGGDVEKATANGKGDEHKLEAEDDCGIPYDRGWAWMISLCCFVMFFTYISNDIVISVLLMDFVDEMNTSVSTITITLAVGSMVYCLVTQITVNLLLKKFSNRLLVSSGAVLNVSATLLLSVFPVTPVFVLAIALKTMCKGLSLISTVNLVGIYFRKKRGVAISLGFMGISVSSMAVPPFVRFCKDHYGLKGCLMLIACYEMQAIVAGMLLRPLSSYRRRRLNDASQANGHRKLSDPKCALNNSKEPANQETAKASQEHLEPLLTQTEAKPPPPPTSLPPSGGGCADSLRYGKVNLEVGSGTLGSMEKMRSSACKGASQNTLPTEDLQSSYLQDPHKKDDSLIVFESDLVSRLKGSRRSLAWSSLSNLSFVSVGDVGLSCQNMEEIKELNPTEKNCLWRVLVKIFTTIVSVHVFMSGLGLMLIFNYIFMNTNIFINIYLYSYATKVGISPQRAATILTALGFADLAGRLSSGFIVDRKWLRPASMLSIAALSVGLVSQFAVFYTEYQSLLFFAIVMGWLAPSAQTLYPVFIIDIVGVENLPPVYATCSMMVSIALAVQFPIQGLLVEYTGDFLPSFTYAGCCYLMSFVLLLCEPLIRRCETKSGRISRLKR